jgi:hypothetical protein
VAEPAALDGLPEEHPEPSPVVQVVRMDAVQVGFASVPS